MSDYFGKDTPKLGFGMMRLPRKMLAIDIEQTKAMVDLFMEAGFTYFDTAFIYPGSEEATGKALVSRYPRESFTLATKLNAGIPGMTEKAAKSEFVTSLKRTGAEYFDYYLLHNLLRSNYKRYEKLHIWEFAEEQKQKGLIKHIGFSFHDGPELLDAVLTEHPEVDFVQLQLNYADWENKKILSRRNYEVARKHNKSIVVMEPVKGGKLADPPQEVKKLFSDYSPDMSYASWAIRFAASLDGIITVLSGMSNLDQVKDNISYMKDFKPLNAREQEIIRSAQEIFGKSVTVPCTSCRYCIEGCPKNIPIPDIFTALNMHLSNGQTEAARENIAEVTQGKGRASDCITCRRCEGVCPQHIDITAQLKAAAEILE
ncbi:MAG: aldo/keto reductase [Oscillospiraceae bacterium]|nr:aldo/keto reductase [Oscillospiraceae bacterium]